MFRLIGLGLALAMAAWTQTPPGGGGTTPPGGGSTAPPAGSTSTVTGMGTVPTGPVADRGLSNTPLMSMTLAVSGRVLIGRNLPPPDPVPVSIVCAGPQIPAGDRSPERSTVTDDKGRFSLVLGQMVAAGKNANGLGGMPRMTGCEAVVRLPGFEPYKKDLARVVSLADLDLGNILLKPSGTLGSGTVISQTGYSAPAAAKKHYQRALQDASVRNDTDAIERLRMAVKVYPAYAVAHYTLGQVLDRLGRRDEAKAAYQAAASADSNYLSPVLQLAQMGAEERDWKVAAQQARRAIELAPSEFPDMYLILAGAQFNAQDFAAAEQSAQAGLKANAASRAPRLHLLLGETLERLKRFDEAKEHYLAFARIAGNDPEGEYAQRRALAMEKQARAR